MVRVDCRAFAATVEEEKEGARLETGDRYEVRVRMRVCYCKSKSTSKSKSESKRVSQVGTVLYSYSS